MKEIHLANGRGIALVDDDDYERIMQHSWCYNKHKHKANCYAQSRIGGKLVKMHRFIMNASKGDPAIDHVDHNGLNNQKCNLRFATQGQNNANMRNIRKGKTSKYKGVHLSCGKWYAESRIDNKGVYLGCYAIEEHAARAYDQFLIEHFGEFAETNGIDASVIPVPYKAKGYGWSKASKKWRAFTFKDGKQVHLGLHETEQLARAAYESFYSLSA